MIPRNILIALAVAIFYILHQDTWLWNRVRPLVFGFLPAGLFYHAVYTVAAAVVMIVLVRIAWPRHLDPGDD